MVTSTFIRAWVGVVAGMLLVGSGPAAAADLQYHRFRFFLHPGVVGDLSGPELERRLALYVEDINTLFARQTIRRFRFDPRTDVLVTEGVPYSGHAGDCGRVDHEVWAHVVPSTIPELGSYGGYMAYDDSCARVAADLHWAAVYDRDRVRAEPGSEALGQYGRQLHHLVHEIEHMFGAGIGEYYNLLTVGDTTGVGPVASIDFRSAADLFWSIHQDFLTDPLTRPASGETWLDLMTQVRFAEVTAAVINARVTGSLAATLPDLSRTQVTVVEAGSGGALPGAWVKAWNVRSFAPYDCRLILDAVTDRAGRVSFAWPGGFSNYDHLLLVKAGHAAAPQGVAQWVSIYEAQAARLLRGETNLAIRLTLADVARLSLRRTATATVVSWPAQPAGVLLQSSTAAPFGDWHPVLLPVADLGERAAVSVPLTGPRRFYRLLIRGENP